MEISSAPLGTVSRTNIALAAVAFFNPFHYHKNCSVLGQSVDPECPNRPFCVNEFLQYLDRKKILDRDPTRYVFSIVHLLERMAHVGTLMRSADFPKWRFLHARTYIYLPTLTPSRSKGLFWLAAAIGADYLYHMSAPAIIHITGISKQSGDVEAGTGLVIDPHHILTCRHVVTDMVVDQTSDIPGRPIYCGGKEHP